MDRDDLAPTRRLSRGALLRGALTMGAGAALIDPLEALAAPSHAASPNTEIQVTVFSPRPGEVAGIGGAGFIVDLALDASPGHNADLESSVRFIAPTDPAFGPGFNPAVPGLVVLFSTTKAFSGPQTNLANLFQITTFETVNGNQKEVWSTWLVGKPIAGIDVDTTLTVFVVSGTAPSVVPADQSTLPIISNVVTVAFHLGA
jgi:hypothetical protein